MVAPLDDARLTALALVLLPYAALCGGIWWRERQRARAAARAAAALLPGGDAGAPLLVAHASQTGTAEALAWQTAQALQLAGVPARIASLATLGTADLVAAERALFIVSTYGEGDPPDPAAPFTRRALDGGAAALAGLHYGVLALGDRTYANFCGFGRWLDGWLAGQGARPMFDRIDVDDSDAAALADWRHHLARIAGTRDAPDWSAPIFGRWRLAARRPLNPGSDGAPACHLELEPAGGAPLPDWQAGDLLQLVPPTDPDRPREYSIASTPADGRIELLVRLARRDDGSTGAASGWLIETAALGDTFDARIRAHPGFRLGDNAARPLILIGNGTGIAGLRGLLKARAAGAGGVPPAPAWLLFGERSARHDAFYDDDLTRWLASGVLTRCDRIYSRDQPARRYVQHRLAETIADVVAWVDDGAAIYVCGSLEGMAGGVDRVLADGLGRERLDGLIAAGRYRRDVY
ncbi:MAG: sulfite reductase subunit alpha [Lautropia sp.]